jgi:hypothetical protein
MPLTVKKQRQHVRASGSAISAPISANSFALLMQAQMGVCPKRDKLTVRQFDRIRSVTVRTADAKCFDCDRSGFRNDCGLQTLHHKLQE